MTKKVDRIVIGGTHSGCGKTTVVCAVLKALCSRKMRVSAFKCGPDYIDPMFQKKVIKINSHNLDSFFCDENSIKNLLCEYGEEISVIEGVMGFYDGAGGRGSAHSVSQITCSPAIVVVDCKGMGDSIGAVLKGFLEYKKPNNICGFIFNRLPESLCERVKNICAELGTRYFGRFPNCNFSIASRHLGLVTADEIADIDEELSQLGKIAEQHLDINGIIETARTCELEFSPIEIPKIAKNKPVKIAVARDEAFCFCYSENLDLLRKMGCEIEFFSPLHDKKLPDKICGIILGGGYPEMYAKSLSDNAEFRENLYLKLQSKIPFIAECGGFMYLHKRLCDAENNSFPSVGFFNGEVEKTDKLQNFGYIKMTAKTDNLLCRKGEFVRAHEFHYCKSSNPGCGFHAEKASGTAWECAFAGENFYAGFPHLYFYSDIKIAENFVKKCVEFGEKNE